MPLLSGLENVPLASTRKLKVFRVFFKGRGTRFLNNCFFFGFMEQIICTSCSKRITNDPGTASFKCPNCGEAVIIRCGHCREVVAKYKCPKCGFEGPN
jgi:predicted RNA-binding Zn-ribbon protein involved in translation (DUF1610 family)